MKKSNIIKVVILISSISFSAGCRSIVPGLQEMQGMLGSAGNTAAGGSSKAIAGEEGIRDLTRGIPGAENMLSSNPLNSLGIPADPFAISSLIDEKKMQGILGVIGNTATNKPFMDIAGGAGIGNQINEIPGTENILSLNPLNRIVHLPVDPSAISPFIGEEKMQGIMGGIGNTAADEAFKNIAGGTLIETQIKDILGAKSVLSSNPLNRIALPADPSAVISLKGKEEMQENLGGSGNSVASELFKKVVGGAGIGDQTKEIPGAKNDLSSNPLNRIALPADQSAVSSLIGKEEMQGKLGSSGNSVASELFKKIDGGAVIGDQTKEIPGAKNFLSSNPLNRIALPADPSAVISLIGKKEMQGKLGGTGNSVKSELFKKIAGEAVIGDQTKEIPGAKKELSSNSLNNISIPADPTAISSLIDEKKIQGIMGVIANTAVEGSFKDITGGAGVRDQTKETPLAKNVLSLNPLNRRVLPADPFAVSSLIGKEETQGKLGSTENTAAGGSIEDITVGAAIGEKTKGKPGSKNVSSSNPINSIAISAVSSIMGDEKLTSKLSDAEGFGGLGSLFQLGKKHILKLSNKDDTHDSRKETKNNNEKDVISDNLGSKIGIDKIDDVSKENTFSDHMKIPDEGIDFTDLMEHSEDKSKTSASAEDKNETKETSKSEDISESKSDESQSFFNFGRKHFGSNIFG